METKITLQCMRCQTPLDHRLEIDRWGELLFEVDPCERCTGDLETEITELKMEQEEKKDNG